MQREREKKRKADEKRAKKLARKNGELALPPMEDPFDSDGDDNSTDAAESNTDDATVTDNATTQRD